MFTKQIGIVIVLLLLVGGIVTFLVMKPGQVPSKTSQVSIPSPIPTPTPTPINYLIWTDEAGFSFQYPEGTTVDKHPEDSKNYANLTLTLPSRDIVSILMSDTSSKTLEAAVGNNSALDTTLGGTAAKKYFGGSQETIICIDNGVLVTITGKDISKIAASWEFIYPTKATAATSNTAGDSDGGDVLEAE